MNNLIKLIIIAITFTISLPSQAEEVGQWSIGIRTDIVFFNGKSDRIYRICVDDGRIVLDSFDELNIHKGNCVDVEGTFISGKTEGVDAKGTYQFIH